MFRKMDLWKPVAAVVLACIVFFASGLLEASTGNSRGPFQFGPNPDFQHSDDTIEILILLEEQADTEQIALKARLEQAEPASSVERREQKIVVRTEVSETLKQKSATSQAPVLQYLRALGVEEKDIRSFHLVNLIYARVSEDLVETIKNRDDVADVLENEIIESVEPLAPEFELSSLQGIEWNISQIGASRVWRDFGVDGSGVVIGIIDTGVDMGHPALKTKYRGFNSTAPDNPDHQYNWYDPYRTETSPDDLNGHGSHVLGIALGSEPGEKNQIGVAPGAQWIAARGFNDLMEVPRASSAILLACMEFMLEPTPNPDGSGTPDPAKAPDILLNSWSSGLFCAPIFEIAMDNLRHAEILPVFSAGNSGPNPGTIGLPANYETAFTVGATNPNKELANFSSRGPSPCGDFWKPDLSAPGVNIRSVLSEVPANQFERPERNRGYVVLSGTSMAAPHVAGVAALLKSSDPSLSIAELEAIMIQTADPLTNDSYPDSPNFGFGYGLINAYAAVFAINDIKVTSHLYWQNVAGGGLKVWQMNGPYQVGQRIMLEEASDPGWKVKAVHDMNGSNEADLIWQHDDGRLEVWYMEGLKKAGKAPIINYSGREGLENPAWKIKAVTDLNGNGEADLIWQRSDGELAFWLMEGLKAYQTGRLLHKDSQSAVDPAWEIGAVADLLGDGRPEIIWQAVSGKFKDELAYWQLSLEGNELKSTASGRLSNVDGRTEIKSDWQIKAAYDLLDNGKPEIIFQGSGGQFQGRVSYWTMEGANKIGGGRLSPDRVSDPQWQIIGASN